MSERSSSSSFTNPVTEAPVGPPMIGALMRLPWEAVMRRMLRALQVNGFDDINAPHLAVLLWPGPDGQRPSALATRMRVTKQALNHLLRDLERMGYLELEPDPVDRRARIIRLTGRGRLLVPVIRTAVADAQSEWAAELGEERFAQLISLLVDLNEIVASEG